MVVKKFVTHSFRVLQAAIRNGWLPGARYTNLRDVRRFERVGFLDIDWKNYSFKQHLAAAALVRPHVTVARDIEALTELQRVLDQAYELSMHSDIVIIVPKDVAMADGLEELIPHQFMLGYSVPTRYGGTKLPLKAFKRPVHLLGGRPDVQRRIADQLTVASIDCNRFTLDAAFGDYFDGTQFSPHPRGGYDRCIEDSISNINALWQGYRPKRPPKSNYAV